MAYTLCKPGKAHVGGGRCVYTKSPTVGSRARVWHGNAHHTSGGLTKADLKKKSSGRIVSKRASDRAAKRLQSNPRLRAAFAANSRFVKLHKKVPTKSQAAHPSKSGTLRPTRGPTRRRRTEAERLAY